MARAPASVVSAAVRRPSTVYLHCCIGVVGRAWRRGVVHFSTAGSHARSTAGPLAADAAAPLGESCRLARRDPTQVSPTAAAESRLADENRLHREACVSGSADQKQLSELLDRAGLLGHEPPAGRVLTLVGSQRSRFRPSFLQAFDEFRRLFESSAALGTPQLVQHRFWAAVREGALRGRGQAGFLDVRVRLSLLAEEEEDRLAVFPVADQRTESVDVGFADLPIPYGSWRFALVPKGGADSGCGSA